MSAKSQVYAKFLSINRYLNFVSGLLGSNPAIFIIQISHASVSSLRVIWFVNAFTKFKFARSLFAKFEFAVPNQMNLTQNNNKINVILTVKFFWWNWLSIGANLFRPTNFMWKVNVEFCEMTQDLVCREWKILVLSSRILEWVHFLHSNEGECTHLHRAAL